MTIGAGHADVSVGPISTAVAEIRPRYLLQTGILSR